MKTKKDAKKEKRAYNRRYTLEEARAIINLENNLREAETLVQTLRNSGDRIPDFLQADVKQMTYELEQAKKNTGSFFPTKPQ